MNHVLLCTDLDRTLLPNGSQPESPGARALFHQLASHEQLTLAYVSGRDRALVEAAIEQYQLPRPDYVIADVGTSIYTVSGDEWQFWPTWHRLIVVLRVLEILFLLLLPLLLVAAVAVLSN